MSLAKTNKRRLTKEEIEQDTLKWCESHKGSNGYFSPMEREYLNQSTTVETQEGKVKGKENWLNRHFYNDERSERVERSQDLKDEFLTRLNAKVKYLSNGGHLKKQTMSAPPIQSSKDTEGVGEHPIYMTLFFVCSVTFLILIIQILYD